MRAVMQSAPAHLAAIGEAAVIQRSFMPPPVYAGAFVDAAAETRPCSTVGGDFYDYLDDDGRFHLLLGDVCGNGTPAALQAALVQGFLAVELRRHSNAADVVAKLNRMLCRRGMAERFVTLFYGLITRDSAFTYCNAGQCEPILVTGGSVRRLSVGGVPPGLFRDAAYEQESMRICSGDTLAVFSDGVTEAIRMDQTFGDERILEVLDEHRGSNAAAIRTALMEAVRKFTAGAQQRDDITILVVRYL